MKRRLALLAMTLVFAALPLAASQHEAVSFIDEMVRAIGATPVACSADVLDNTQSYDMQVVCATFDGDFEQFQWRWTMHLLQNALANQRNGSGKLPHTEPQTSWERHGAIHERIYAVGRTVVGVRFHLGELILVYG